MALKIPPKGPRFFLKSSIVTILSDDKCLFGSFATIRTSLNYSLSLIKYNQIRILPLNCACVLSLPKRFDFPPASTTAKILL
jgi:hypothetical protein